MHTNNRRSRISPIDGPFPKTNGRRLTGTKASRVGFTLFNMVHTSSSVGAKSVLGSRLLLLADFGVSVQAVLDQNIFHHGGTFDRLGNLAIAIIFWVAPIVVHADGHWPKALRHSIGADLVGKGTIITDKTIAPTFLARRDGGHAFRVAVIVVVRNAAGYVRPTKGWGTIIQGFDDEACDCERGELPQEKGRSDDARTRTK
jgi:hypothetical protein